MTHSGRSELALVRALALSGDPAAMEEMSSRLARCVTFVLNQRGWFKAVSLSMREEIVEESLVRLIDRVQRGFDGDDAQFKTYVYRVVYSVTSSEARAASRSRSLDEEITRADGSRLPLRDLILGETSPWLGKVAEATDPLEGMARDERARRVAEALGSLAPTDRELLRLFEVEGLSTREISQRMDLKENNVSVRLHRARDRMCRAYLHSYARGEAGIDQQWISSLIESLPREEAAVLQSWWEEGGSVREIGARLGMPERRCRDLLDRGRSDLARLAEETRHAS